MGALVEPKYTVLERFRVESYQSSRYLVDGEREKLYSQNKALLSSESEVKIDP